MCHFQSCLNRCKLFETKCKTFFGCPETLPPPLFSDVEGFKFMIIFIVNYFQFLSLSDSVASHMHTHKSHTHRQYNEQFMIRAPDRYLHLHFYFYLFLLFHLHFFVFYLHLFRI